MRNEKAVLPRLLESIYPILDYYVVVDTGSADSSKEIVKDFFDSKNIPGEIYDHPFINFEDARNFALSKLKGKADRGFWIDCDEELVIHKDFNLAQFKKDIENYDVGYINVDYNTTNYVRKNFLKIDKPFYWKGKVHEYLTCDEPFSEFLIKGIEMLVHSDGASWANQKEKYLSHAAILEKEVAERNDPRDVFYLAQSYRDAGEHQKAIEWYRKRAVMEDGFFEERYYSQFVIANLCAELKEDYPKVIFEWLSCSKLDNMKAEYLVNVMYELQNKQFWEIAYIFSKYAMEKFYLKNPYPQRTLFLNNACYEGELLNIHIQNCIVLGKADELKKLKGELSIDQFFQYTISAWKGHKEFAEWLVNEMSPNVIVDLGIDYGFSTYCFALAKKGKVYGIDHFKGDSFTGIRDTHALVMENLEYLKTKGITNIEIIKGEFNNVAKGWKKKIDILHIDEVPTEIKNDFYTWGEFLSDDGVILLHNTQAFPEVKEFFKELRLNKLEFPESGGLGIVTKNEELIAKIKEKYFKAPEKMEIKPEKITIGYIAHNNEVLKKCLMPSLENLKGEFDIVAVHSKDNLPAVNYNKLVEMSATRYIILVHEDVTFSPDFLNKVNEVINKHPDFGAIGIVGNYNHNYQWSEVDKIHEVKTFDGCCVLINKEHGIKFDIETFNEFHLYVEDYCMQVTESLGLKCYTISINASEADKNDTYIKEGSYFRHHSATVNERGFCWGNYNEYFKKLQDKWSKKPKEQVDVCIISYAKTDELREVTERGIETLLASEHNIDFHIYVVESNKEVSYNMYHNTKTIYTDLPFNYNAYLNLAIVQGKSEYVVLCNNDLTYSKGWASNIIKEMKANPEILSSSPFCPQTQNKKDFPNNIYFGYTVRRELAGWCIFQQRKIYDIIFALSEKVDFWYSDNIYSDQLVVNNLKHMLVTTSTVSHHEKNLGITGEKTLGVYEMQDLTTGQYEKYLKAKEKYNG